MTSPAAEARLPAESQLAARAGTAARIVRTAVDALIANPGLSVGLGLILVLAGFAFLGPIVWPRDPIAIDLGSSLVPPSVVHPMGTDASGRDILARFDAGARISLLVAFAVVLAGAGFGGAIGVISATMGGLADQILMRSLDAILAFPPLILAMAITVGLGPGLQTAALAIVVTAVPYFGRLLRSDIMRLLALPHIEASVALGATPARVIFRHVLPHTASTMLVQSSSMFGYAILTLAGLGFVGLGAQIPTPEWGAMITEGFEFVVTGQWWVSFFPGLGVLMAVVAANVLAEQLRETLNPGESRQAQ